MAQSKTLPSKAVIYSKLSHKVVGAVAVDKIELIFVNVIIIQLDTVAFQRIYLQTDTGTLLLVLSRSTYVFKFAGPATIHAFSCLFNLLVFTGVQSILPTCKKPLCRTPLDWFRAFCIDFEHKKIVWLRVWLLITDAFPTVGYYNLRLRVLYLKIHSLFFHIEPQLSDQDFTAD